MFPEYLYSMPFLAITTVEFSIIFSLELGEHRKVKGFLGIKEMKKLTGITICRYKFNFSNFIT